MHKKDWMLLKHIQRFLGGIGSINEKPNSVSLKIQTRDLGVLINHFDKYPLITKKQADFLLFKKVVELMNNKSHLNPIGLNEILALKASMNNGLSEVLLKSFPNIQRATRPLVNTTEIPDPMWVAGFTSGEGSFNINIAKSPNTVTGYKIGLKFQITQHTRDAELLKLIVNYFNCGYYYSVAQARENQKIGNYVVSDVKNITDIIVPFFEKYPILGNKELDFSDFYIALNLIQNKKHLDEFGLEQLRKLKLGMNRGRKNE